MVCNEYSDLTGTTAKNKGEKRIFEKMSAPTQFLYRD